MSPVLLFPMAAHVAWAALLYVVLTLARAPTVWGLGCRADGTNPWAAPWAALEPRISANLSNQFEWPLFFHAGCIALLLLQPVPGLPALILAWIFVTGRMLHSAVQILTTNIRLRGLVFMVNFLAVLGLWGVIVLDALQRGT